jgi:hypothetical protein
MAAKKTPHRAYPGGGINPAQGAAKLLEGFGPKVVESWLMEFGYIQVRLDNAADFTMDDTSHSLTVAVAERGPRILRELTKHRERMAAKATMAPSLRITARSTVLA